MKRESTPNQENRDEEVDTIIIHSMSEYISDQYASDFLQSIGLSAHYLITPDGDIIETVNPERKAYHAGASKLNDKSNLNTYSIGIEILVEGHHTYSSFKAAIKDSDTFTAYQYDVAAILCALLMEEFPQITFERIVKHSDVSGDDVRGEGKGKVDPGDGFDWELLIELISHYNNLLKITQAK